MLGTSLTHCHRLDEGNRISNTLTRNHATWHASCRLKCCVVSRVARIVQPSRGTSETHEGHPYMRRQVTRREISIEECKINVSSVTKLERKLLLDDTDDHTTC